MDKFESLNHTKLDCKYHIVFIPKGCRKGLYGQLRSHLGGVFRGLAQHKESRIEERHLMADHVHMMISVPPKYAVSNVVGYIKGKSAVHLARMYSERKRNFAGQNFWARGYFVSTVGRVEEWRSTVSTTVWKWLFIRHWRWQKIGVRSCIATFPPVPSTTAVLKPGRLHSRHCLVTNRTSFGQSELQAKMRLTRVHSC